MSNYEDSTRELLTKENIITPEGEEEKLTPWKELFTEAHELWSQPERETMQEGIDVFLHFFMRRSPPADTIVTMLAMAAMAKYYKAENTELKSKDVFTGGYGA